MPENRRTPRRGAAARGPAGPGRGAGAARGARPVPSRPAAAEPRARRPRLTGRAGVLVLVLVVLAVSYASSMRAFLEQREHLDDLQSTIAERQASIEELEREKRRWSDPAYVEQEARDRLGYVMPGEVPYVALDEDGNPIESQATLSDPTEVDRKEPEAWWTDAWGSVLAAGDPPRDNTVPSTTIDGSTDPKGNPQKENQGQ
ncbi:FtsB family cell division protein [Nocardioides pantholopis]|uniref:FtsB family cell division protein n=2 Tax=Nocardioides pantholopis TaxID=2483798 RepID=UPI000F0773C8|nr:septum formation initiator family protein [Nocardioides pantholopis]